MSVLREGKSLSVASRSGDLSLNLDHSGPSRIDDAKVFALRQAIFPFVALLILCFIHWDGFFRGPYIDDTDLIFSNSFIRDGHNPLLYWFRGQYDTKAWPLAHTVFWLCFRLFHRNFWAYRALSLALHWLNGVVLLSFLSKRVRWPAAAFAATLFWFHPVTVEPVQWISQVGTLLTTLAFAYWLAAIERGGSPRRSFFWLCGMLATKGFAYVLPLLSLRKRLTETSPGRALLGSAPAFLAAAYAIFLLYVGIGTAQDKNRLMADRGAAHASAGGEWIRGKHETLAQKPTPPASAAVASPVSETKDAQARTAPLRFLYERVALCGKSALFYFFRLLSYAEIPPDSLRPISPGAGSPFFFFLGSGVLAGLFWCVLRRKYVLASGILLYLPVSGLFPAPFLSFSLVSDRMIYPSLYVFAYALGMYYDRLEMKGLRRSFWLWPLLLGAAAFFVARLPRADFSYLLTSHQ